MIGLRDIRDYRIFSDKTQRCVIGGSAFNIKEKSIRLPYFTPDQVNRPYQQHTDATGQKFEQEALDAVYHYTQEQPWLVNSIGRELWKQGKNSSPSTSIKLSLDSGYMVLFHRHSIEDGETLGEGEQIQFEGKRIELIRL